MLIFSAASLPFYYTRASAEKFPGVGKRKNKGEKYHH